MQLSQAKQQHWTQSALQQLQRSALAAAKSAAAAVPAATAAAAAASAAAAAAGRGASVSAGTPGQQQEPPPQHTEQYSSRRASSAGPAAAAAVTAADGLLGSIYGATSLSEEQQQQQAAAAQETAEKHAAATAARAAAAESAAAAAAWEWQQSLRVACYTTEQGLMDVQQVVAFLVKCLSSRSNSSSSHKLRETALVLGDAAAEQICSCQPLAASLSSCLVGLMTHLDSLTDRRQGSAPAADLATASVEAAQQQGAQVQQAGAGGAKGAVAAAVRNSGAGGAGTGSSGNASGSSSSSLWRLADGLLQKLLLLAPANLTSLDCLPQLCRSLLGPAAAHSLLYDHSSCTDACFAPSSGGCGSNGGSNGSSAAAQELLAAREAIAGNLLSVLSMARQMAAAVSPRCVCVGPKHNQSTLTCDDSTVTIDANTCHLSAQVSL